MNTLTKVAVGLLLTLPLSLHAATRPATPFTDAELDQLLAPIALYPDSVLSHVLIAATVPEEVEAAAKWSRRHPDLRGQAAVDAVEGMDWDPSVKALVAFSEVLERMDEDPEWTENVGEAFLAQEAGVMDRVQVLRDRADEAGNLDSVEHVRVVREREYIYLEPAVAHFVYVPYYDPWYVYGAWWWPYYPPHRWAYWGGHPARYYYGSTFYWGVGLRLAPTYYYGSFNWPARHVVVTRPHRHYAPSPGYSGHSTMRRDAPRDTRRSHRDAPRRGNDAWRHDNRRENPARRENPPGHRRERLQRAPGGRDTPRRHWSDVQQQLRERRESRPHDRPEVRSEARSEGWRQHGQRDSGREQRRDPERGSSRGLALPRDEAVSHARPQQDAGVREAPRERGGGTQRGQATRENEGAERRGGATRPEHSREQGRGHREQRR